MNVLYSLMNENHSLYTCPDHMAYHFLELSTQLERDEIMTITLRFAKAKQCMYEKCKKSGNYLLVAQFFEQVQKKTLK